MAYKKSPQAFSASINAVTIGKGDSAVTLGGENVMPLYSFDAPIEHRPAVGIAVSDTGIRDDLPKYDEFYAGTTSLLDRAKKAAALDEADFVTVILDAADPNGENRSVEDCVAEVKAIAEAIDKPIAVEGCKNIEKDTELFSKISEALQGENILLLSAREEDYKTVGASAVMAYQQKMGAESADDINLAKQLNVLITQLGVDAGSIVMNVGTAAAGYGFEYVVSTMDRVKAAALAQNDTMLQMPIVTPLSNETWTVKESLVSGDDIEGWGPVEERGIQMEVTTAAACLASGSNAVILMHPESVKTISAFIADLM
jgi:acetyl-CoA decarbonylase/synthase complex subunit delta